MKSNTKSMLLTLVLVLMSSVSWGQEKCPGQKTKLEEAKDAAKECSLPSMTPEKTKECSTTLTGLNRAVREAQKVYDDCLSSSVEEKEFCTKTDTSIKERLKDFDYTAQKKALECMEGGSESEADTTRAVLLGLGGQPMFSENLCSPNSSKASYSTQLEKKTTLVEKLEKEIKAIDEKIVKQKKEAVDQLAKDNEDRIKLKEEWEKRQTDQEAEQARALNAMRENQIKVQEAIRKANAELINARQDMAKAERKRSEELLKAGVQSFSSMSRICNAQVKDYYKKAELNKKKKSGSLGGALGKGSSKKKDLQSFLDDCLKSMEEKRNAIYEDTTNYLVQMVNNIKDRQESIATLEGEYKNQADNYKKAIEREASALSKDQQAFLQKDQNLANKIAQYQQTSAQEANDLLQQKLRAQQSLAAAISSKGEIGILESRAGVEALKAHMNEIEALAGGKISETGAIIDADGKTLAKPRCAEFATYRSQVKEFKSFSERMTELPGQQ